MSIPLHVLLVEDSVNDAELLELELKRGNYAPVITRVDTAESLQKSLHETAWDMVISDYNIPGFNGMEALEIFKSYQLDIPFILMSGVVSEDAAAEAMVRGANDYIMKDHRARLLPAIARELHATKARREKRESEARYRRITETITDYIYTVRVENGVVVATEHGPGCINITGYSGEEFAADAYLWLKIVVQEDRDSVLAQGQRALADQETAPLEHRIIRKDGMLRWIRNAVLRRHNADGNLVGYDGLIQDVTERRLAEQALRLSEEQYRAIVENTPDIISRFDREGRHLYTSSAVESVLGISVENFIGKTHEEMGFPKPLVEYFRAHIAKVFETGLPDESEFHFDKPSGQLTINWRLYPLCDDAGNVMSILSLGRDVTQHRKAEHDYQRLFNEMINGFAVHQIICDAQGKPIDYRFQVVNPAFERLTGWKAQDILGKTVREIAPDIESIWIEKYGEVALTQVPIEFEHFSAALNRHYNVTAYSPAQGEFACIFEDVTEKSQAEDDRRKLQEQLEQAQKMEAIGHLAGGIAHDFNNILSVVIGYSEIMMTTPLYQDPRIKVPCQEIRKSARRAKSLVEHLLAFGRKQSLDMRPTDVVQVIAEMESMVRRLIGEDVDVVTILPPSTDMILADSSQIEQVLLNFAVNSRDAMTGTGAFTIETGRVVLDEQTIQPFFELKPGPYLTLKVSDTGCGMTAETLKHLFEPFFTTKEKGKGTGLGLSTVYGIVKQHGGDIQVQSVLGAGTTFTIYFPILKGNISCAGEHTECYENTAEGTEKILVIEDDETLRHLVCTMLGMYGYQAIEALDGKDAIRLVTERDDIDMLLSDVVMPDLNGKQIYDRVVSIRPGLPALFMSGYTDAALAQRNHLDVKNLLIRKPFTAQSLCHKIRKILTKAIT
ncbi:TPA: hypothetical protein DDW35_02905 [Candidatus Sumerlaeota bacterium]|jgi:PAS domain S-box-containing protein|nr:hypothetical protein [Candidatus Sumerlaeota bacterium]